MHAPISIQDMVYFFGTATLLIIVVEMLRSSFERKRSRELAAAATQLGLSFHKSDTTPSPTAPHPDKNDSPFLPTVLFERGRKKQCSNLMAGRFSDIPVNAFDYKYTEGTGKHSHTLKQTVAAFTPRADWLPEFELAPSGLFHKIGDAIVHKDVKFDSHPTFSSRYMLRGPEADNIRELFTPALLSYLESLDSGKKWHIEGSAGTLVIYRSDERVAPNDLRGFLEEASAIARSFFTMSGATKSAKA